MEKKRKFDNRYCIAFGCLNSNKKIPDLSLFSLPKETERRKKWLTLVGREDLIDIDSSKCKCYEVCSAHFDESTIKTIKQLKPGTIPTKSLYNDDGERIPTPTNDPLDISSQIDSVPVTSQIVAQKSKIVSVGTQTEVKLSSKTTQTKHNLPKRKLSEEQSEHDSEDDDKERRWKKSRKKSPRSRK